VERITKALRAGNTRRNACALGGIHHDTFYTWLKEFSEFSDAVMRAEAECEAHAVGMIQKAGIEHQVLRHRTKTLPDGTVLIEETLTTEWDWNAAAWWLERRFPDDWKLRTATELTGSGPNGEVLFRFDDDVDEIYGKRKQEESGAEPDAGGS
jgi:hypothetical protein